MFTPSIQLLISRWKERQKELEKSEAELDEANSPNIDQLIKLWAAISVYDDTLNLIEEYSTLYTDVASLLLMLQENMEDARQRRAHAKYRTFENTFQWGRAFALRQLIEDCTDWPEDRKVRARVLAAQGKTPRDIRTIIGGCKERTILYWLQESDSNDA